MCRLVHDIASKINYGDRDSVGNNAATSTFLSFGRYVFVFILLIDMIKNNEWVGFFGENCLNDYYLFN